MTISAAATPRGYVLPVPEAKSLSDEVKAILKGLRGRLVTSKTFTSGLGDRAAGIPRDYETSRIGARPDDQVVALHAPLRAAVAAACGVPPPLVAERGDGTAQREAYRRFLHLTIRPVAGMVGLELARVLEEPVALEFPELKAADIAGAARAFRTLVGKDATMEVAEALTLTGLR